MTQSSSPPLTWRSGHWMPGQDPGRPDVGVLVERLADREAQAPERQVVRHVRRADSAEQDGVEGAKLVGAVGRHERARALVAVGAPVEIFDVEAEAAVALGEHIQHFKAGSDDLHADPVAADGGELVGSMFIR